MSIGIWRLKLDIFRGKRKLGTLDTQHCIFMRNCLSKSWSELLKSIKTQSIAFYAIGASKLISTKAVFVS